MTVPASQSPPRRDYIAAGGQTTFPYTWQIYESTDLRVYQNGVIISAYSVTGVLDPVGGNVVLTTGATAGDTIAILCHMPLSQEADYVELNSFPAETHERALDKLTRIAQQFSEEFSRTFQMAESSIAGSPVLPSPAIGKFLRWIATVPPSLENADIVALGALGLPVSPTDGGTGQDTSGWTGITVIRAGAWALQRGFIPGPAPSGGDDTGALQDAITASANKVLLLQDGTYLHAGLSFASPLRMCGLATMAGTQTMLSYTGAGTGITLTGNSVALQDLVAQTATGAVGIDLSSTLYHRFLNLNVLGNSTTQYKADNAYYVQWKDGTVQGKNGTSGTTAGITSTVNFNANLIDGVRFLMGVGPTDIWTALKINSAGIAGTSAGSTVRDCIFDGGYSGGVSIHAYAGTSGLLLNGNRLEGNGQNFLLQDDNAFGITVLGGTVEGSDTVPAPRLFDLSGGDVFIAGVDIRAATEGIHFGATARRITEMNNAWTNVVTKLSNTDGLDGILSLYNGQMNLRGGYHTLSALTANPAAGQQNSQGHLYIKGTKLVVEWNNDGTARFLTLDLTQGDGAAVWASTAVAP